jgi:O-antigen/teichoic acid export membrane protein
MSPFAPRRQRNAARKVVESKSMTPANSTSIGSEIVVNPRLDPSAHREQRVKLAAVWSIAARMGTLLVTIVSTPLAIDVLGKDRFGIWIAITTFFSLFGFLDGGVGNAVVNFVTEHRANRTQSRLSNLVSSAYVVLLTTSALGLVLTGVLATTINWRWAISLPDTIAESEARLAVAIVGILFFVNMPLGLAAKIRRGLQESHTNAMFELSGHVVTLAATAIAWWCNASLAWFLLAFAIGPFIANLINSMTLRFNRNVELRPHLRNASSAGMKQALFAGSAFLGLQLCAALAFQSDAIIVSHFCGLPATADLGLVNRMFLIATSITGFVIAPLWPAFRDAAVRGEIAWIKRTFWRTLRSAIVISLAITTPLVFVHQPLIALWTGREIIPSLSLVVAVYVWTNLQVIGNLINSFMHGMNIVNQQLMIAVAMTLLNVPLSIYLTGLMGPAGVVLGSVISYSLCVLAPFCWILPHQLQKLTSQVATDSSSRIMAIPPVAQSTEDTVKANPC